jgi:asparagine synthetase B (glutamine-hydrolysing)
MQERIRQASFSPPFSSYAQQDLFSSTVHGLGIHGTELDERAASFFGLESRHPLNDQRIIEFALALPEEQRWQDKPKSILRKAMGGQLPTSVRERVLKADFSCIFAQALLTESNAAIFQSLSVASMGWVDGGQIWTAYQTMARCYSRGDETYQFHVAPLWMIFGVELWYRTLFQKHRLPPDLPTRQEVAPSYSA